MVRLLAFASLLVIAVVSFNPVSAAPDPMQVVAAATNVAMETGPAAPAMVEEAGKRNTGSRSQIQKKE
ncbi:hypothetical protein PHMEG_00021083 [Phytophthora megakarya]|uniref:RxLR effector protein n=1 Tax=Phytophthora megakarya TaxID=4795 RepID=A0A225VNQ2_9STRA|nr:hypothetical protein PHMEG_00021083 [Phytophthora megakarya]